MEKTLETIVLQYGLWGDIGGYIGLKEKKMEATIQGLWPRVVFKRLF